MNRCAYCGHRCKGDGVCTYHAHLARVERAMRGEQDSWRFGPRTFDVIAALSREAVQ